MHNLLDPSHLIKQFGYIGVFSAVFLESGVVFGFFLPGDSLLFTAGLLASQGYMNIIGLIAVSVAGAILGNNVGFYTGRKLGMGLFNRPKSLIFSPKRVHEAHEFFQERGPQSLILARFIPAVRTFVPIIAGVAEMAYKPFLLFNSIGGVLWGMGMPLLGYTLGSTIPNIDHYLLPIVGLLIVISAIPAVIEYRHSKKRTAARKQAKED